MSNFIKIEKCYMNLDLVQQIEINDNDMEVKFIYDEDVIEFSLTGDQFTDFLDEVECKL